MPANERLRALNHQIFSSLLDQNVRTICIVDPPNHPNVGDSAIFVGEVDLIRNILPKAKLWFTDYLFYSDRCRDKLAETDLIVFHGGGNFGDIWPDAHNFRLKIMQDFPDIPKIQCPQSICFSDDEYLQATRRVIKDQESFYFLARDHKSMKLATDVFDCDVDLCPDMAFSMRPASTLVPQADVAMIWRTDKEKVGDFRAGFVSQLEKRGLPYVEKDWIDEDTNLAWRLDVLLSSRRAGPLAGLPGFYALLFHARLHYALKRVKFGTDFLSSGRVVVTDRLHGMILSNIVERPNFVFDSLDGKVSAFYETWLMDDSYTALALAGGADLVDRVANVLTR